MNIILVGYGQMGIIVEGVLLERHHTIIARIDPITGDTERISENLAGTSDVVIEFSSPDAVLPNANTYCKLHLNAVVGTTGWFDQAPEIRDLVEHNGIGYLYGSNFSIGAHIFYRMVAEAAELINPIPEYDILGYEIHHKRKKDSPSGTALNIANIILNKNERKNKLITDRLDRPVKENELHFASVRGGDNPGIHRVVLDSQADTIELTHSARNRKGFALGAVLAAEWLQGKTGFFEMEDFIQELLPE